jgi:polyphosphate kinase
MKDDDTITNSDANIPPSSFSIPHFFNRDLSWIDFCERVLEEGLREDLPPLDRFWYLSILSANFDEFFMVRVAAMKSSLHSGAGSGGSKESDPSGQKPEEQLKKTAEKIRAITKRQYDCLQNRIFPALAGGGLRLVRPGDYSASQKNYLEAYFRSQIYPILTPLRLEEGDALPFIGGNNLYAAFLLEQEDDGTEHIAIVQHPRGLDRIVWLPGDLSILNDPASFPEDIPPDLAVAGEKSGGDWALLDDLALAWGSLLFPGHRVRESMLFTVNRDADLPVDERRDEDFIEAMEEVVNERSRSPVVRMTYSAGSERLKQELARRLELEEQDLYEHGCPMDLKGLMELASARGFDSLRGKPWKIYTNAAFSEDEPVWNRISQQDVLVHLPYESFDPVARFFQEAAADPQVISIKPALDRTSGNSSIVRALEQAALKGKHVTAVVELKARFDEERNISWANRLEKAGVLVVYGIARLKVHAKISMVIRREREGIKRYVHLSTGNYNDRTARQYEDLGLFTAREDIATDASVFFNMLTGYSAILSMRKLVIAPTFLKRRLLELIEREANRSSREHPGRIIAKLNSLADTDVIEALYRASRAGVNITLVVRGICMLIPGSAGLSENITVISVVGHYLEHSRVYYFANGGSEEYYLASADWMPRNLERRVELMFPVLQEDLKLRIRDILGAYCRDTAQAWKLNPGGSWSRLSPAGGEAPFSAQEQFLSQAEKAGENLWAPRGEFVVRRSPPAGMGDSSVN